MNFSTRAVLSVAALACIAAAPDTNFRAKPVFGRSSGDELILLPSSETHSTQQAESQPYLALVLACADAEPRDIKHRRARLAIWEYSPGIGIAGPSLADRFVGEQIRAQVGGDQSYTLVMIIGEERGAPSGRYTNKALVYSSTFAYCSFDMPARTLAGKSAFTAHPPAQIAKRSTTYQELRRSLAEHLTALPAQTVIPTEATEGHGSTGSP